MGPARPPNAEPETPPALTPAALAAEIAALAGPALPADAPLAVAVSGGADSLALMRLAAAAFGPRLTVLTVDHGLRASAADEARTVAALAGGLGLGCHILQPDAPIAAANVQDGARRARYRAMGQWCLAHGVPVLLTAHHADDQAETLMMRLARGSGLSGLSGIRPVVDLYGVRVVRPLLGWPRAAVRGTLAGSGWTPVDDPANSDARFDRTHARRLLAEADWLMPERLADSARHLQAAEAALAWATDRAWASRATASDGGIALDAEGLPADLQRRLLLRGLDQLGASAPDGPAVERVLARLQANGTGTIAGVRVSAKAAHRWWLVAARPHRP